jgi:hypothetical protein
MDAEPAAAAGLLFASFGDFEGIVFRQICISSRFLANWNLKPSPIAFLIVGTIWLCPKKFCPG